MDPAMSVVLFNGLRTDRELMGYKLFLSTRHGYDHRKLPKYMLGCVDGSSEATTVEPQLYLPVRY